VSDGVVMDGPGGKAAGGELLIVVLTVEIDCSTEWRRVAECLTRASKKR